MKTYTCEYCRKSFEAPRKRKGCDRSCSVKISGFLKGAYPWHEAELKCLERLAGSQPLPKIVATIRRIDSAIGYPKRTTNAVKIQMKRLGLSSVCSLDNFTGYELARILDLPEHRVRSWYQRYNLPVERAYSRFVSISLDTVKAFAKEHPEFFAGVDRDRLDWLFQDADLVEFCLSHKPGQQRLYKRVRRLDTGEVFPSIKEAARRNYVHPSCIQDAIKRNGYSAGSRWEVIDHQSA